MGRPRRKDGAQDRPWVGRVQAVRRKGRSLLQRQYPELPRSFISSVERFRRRHQCSRPRSVCKCEDKCKCKSEKCKCEDTCKCKCAGDYVTG
eukprot:1691714-Prymnesium_polylepis.1